MSLRKFTRTILATSSQRIACTGDLFFVRSATAGFNVTLETRENDQGSRVYANEAPISERQKIKLPLGENFDDITIFNTTGSDIVVTIIAGFGDYDAPLSSVSLAVPNTITAAANVNANAGGVQCLAANANRKIAWVSVLPSATNGAFVAESAAAAAAGKGIPIEPGIAYPIETTAAIFVARNGGADVQVNALETIFT